MNARFFDRLAATLSVILLLILGGATTYLAHQAAKQGEETRERKLTHEPDYFVEGLQFTRVNVRGEAAYRLSAKRLEHFPDDDSSSFTEPVLISLDPAKPQIAVRADRGESSSEGIETHLYGNVVLTRQGDAQRAALSVHTDYAVILSDEDIVRSDRPVLVRNGDSTLNGVGMEFNNASRTLQVDAQVRGTWVMKQR